VTQRGPAEKAIVIVVEINGHKINALVDSGAAISGLNPKICERLGLQTIPAQIQVNGSLELKTHS
jgi:predicted aspartyl protease